MQYTNPKLKESPVIQSKYNERNELKIIALTCQTK